MTDNRIEQLEERIAILEFAAKKPGAIDDDAIYTPAEVSEILKCCKANVYNLLTSGDLAVTRIGSGKHGFRVKGSDLSTFLLHRTEGGPTPKSAFKFLKTSSRRASS